MFSCWFIFQSIFHDFFLFWSVRFSYNNSRQQKYWNTRDNAHFIFSLPLLNPITPREKKKSFICKVHFALKTLSESFLFPCLCVILFTIFLYIFFVYVVYGSLMYRLGRRSTKSFTLTCHRLLLYFFTWEKYHKTDRKDDRCLVSLCDGLLIFDFLSSSPPSSSSLFVADLAVTLRWCACDWFNSTNTKNTSFFSLSFFLLFLAFCPLLLLLLRLPCHSHNISSLFVTSQPFFVVVLGCSITSFPPLLFLPLLNIFFHLFHIFSKNHIAIWLLSLSLFYFSFFFPLYWLGLLFTPIHEWRTSILFLSIVGRLRQHPKASGKGEACFSSLSLTFAHIAHFRSSKNFTELKTNLFPFLSLQTVCFCWVETLF